MRRTGSIDLPLHGGSAPRWLFSRMVKLSSAISEAIVDKHGTKVLLERIADPLWFQAFSCVLGFDWHSSGTTTVTCGALREGLKRANLNVWLAGGKGLQSRSTAADIEGVADSGGISTSLAEALTRSSRLSAKVDSAAVQDGHQLYHHAIVFDSEGNWSVVQQGMCDETGYARRYHWSSSALSSFVEEPHAAIVGTRMPCALDMTSRVARSARRSSVDIVSERKEKVLGLMRAASLGAQRSLAEFEHGSFVPAFRSFAMPKRLDWSALERCYEFRPQSYEELLLVKGVGANIVRALALISQVVYGDELSWQDPVKFSFAVGGKDGVPYPVNRRAMDSATEMLSEAVRQARLGDREREDVLRRLARHQFRFDD
ncbi:MAG: DUF763 domain-containing protein [Thermoplasmata archaeon]